MSTTPKTTTDDDGFQQMLQNNSKEATVRLTAYTRELSAQAHHADHSWYISFREWAKYNALIALIRFVLSNIAIWIKTLILSPATIFNDPLSTMVALIVWPVVFVGLFFETIALKVITSMGGQFVIDWISKTFCQGYSLVNWPAPDLFTNEDTINAIKSARATMSGIPTTFPNVPAPGSTNVDMDNDLATTRIFDLDVAKTLLVFSALVYERDDKLVQKAASEQAHGHHQHAEALVWRSEHRIRKVAEDLWKLRYEGVADLSQPGGSFCSVFYSPPDSKDKFIAVVFKGTSPFSFAEWLVDMTLSRVDCTSYLGGGTCHQGFYSRLFSTNQGGTDSYGTIIRSLKHIAAEMKKGGASDFKVPLWVCGHSLGSAMASLFYNRLMHEPQDLGNNIVLRDAYVYGTPRLGDDLFAAKFDQTCLSPRDRPNIMWRVVNNADIVCRVPPGFSDKDSNKSTMGSSSLVNFAHLGVPFNLVPWFRPYYFVKERFFRSNTRVVVVKDGEQGHDNVGRFDSIAQDRNIVSWIMALTTPAFLYDHAPASYAQHLNKIRVDGQGGDARRGEKLGARIKRQPGA
ncbi:hypothetical protein OIO90_001574 [Microbotryomycetes sp. JL221]|nr:hypothetical protein OIO90_001574 [Microbotryomycetes sp. JL221]